MPRITSLANKGLTYTTFPRPVNTVVPVITGTAQVRQLLSVSTGTWTGFQITYSYQWQYGTTNIPSATSNTYTVASTYVGSAIRCVVTASNFGNIISANTTNTTAVIAAVPSAPTIGIAAGVSSTSATVAFTAPTDNGGATITTYTATSNPGGITGTVSQAGSGTITVNGLTQSTDYTFTVTATNSAGTSSASSPSNQITVGTPAPVNTVAPVVSGTAQVRQTLSSTTGTWTGTGITYSYQWQYGTTNIPSATSSTYVIYQTYVGSAIRCVVTATNAGGSVLANSNATSAVIANVPLAPFIVVGRSGITSATVAFAAPSSNGGANITTYTATSSPGGITGTLSQAGSGTITIAGLTAGTPYTFTVTATNSVGTSSASSPSNPVTPTAAAVSWDMLLMGGGGATATTYVSYVPAGAGDDGVAARHIGAGGGGAGGLLTTTGSSTTGQVLYITVGAGGGATTVASNSYYALTSGGAAVTTAIGGGNGAPEGVSSVSRNGGSGAGASYNYPLASSVVGTGISGQGYAGGTAGTTQGTVTGSGGGGGKNSVGANVTSNNGATGGTGYDLALFKGGVANIVAYGGGGGGGANFTGALGTSGNNGSSTYPTIASAPANTGGGARGSSSALTPVSSTGGSGIIIIRYPGSVAKATGGGSTYTATVGGTAYFFHEFTGSGTLTFN